MSFLNIADLAEANSFKRRMHPAIAKVAGTILTSQPTGRYNVDSKRQTLARQALRDPSSVATAFVWAVLSNPVIAEKGLDATDGELEYQITVSWNTIAGVTVSDEAEPAASTPTIEQPEAPEAE